MVILMLDNIKETLDYRTVSLENPSSLSILPYSDGEREGGGSGPSRETSEAS